METLLDVQQVEISYHGKAVVRDVSFQLEPGEILGIVGESGSGKSTLIKAAMGLLGSGGAVTGGHIYYKGNHVVDAGPEELRRMRGPAMGMIFQHTEASLCPVRSIGDQLYESVSQHEQVSREEVRRRALELFGHMRLKDGDRILNSYPFELSGGMNRRVLVSTALMGSPRLVIADEPTPGLHMDMVRRVMGHFRELADRGAGVLLITHDLEQALQVADRVVVFYSGMTVEDASVQDFQREETLRHPYTRALWRAMPENGLQFLPGTQPYVKDLPEGCPFGPRCETCTEECRREIPVRELRGGSVRCVHAT